MRRWFLLRSWNIQGNPIFQTFTGTFMMGKKEKTEPVSLDRDAWKDWFCSLTTVPDDVDVWLRLFFFLLVVVFILLFYATSVLPHLKSWPNSGTLHLRDYRSALLRPQLFLGSLFWGCPDHTRPPWPGTTVHPGRLSEAGASAGSLWWTPTPSPEQRWCGL